MINLTKLKHPRRNFSLTNTATPAKVLLFLAKALKSVLLCYQRSGLYPSSLETRPRPMNLQITSTQSMLKSACLPSRVAACRDHPKPPSLFIYVLLSVASVSTRLEKLSLYQSRGDRKLSTRNNDSVARKTILSNNQVLAQLTKQSTGLHRHRDLLRGA